MPVRVAWTPASTLASETKTVAAARTPPAPPEATDEAQLVPWFVMVLTPELVQARSVDASAAPVLVVSGRPACTVTAPPEDVMSAAEAVQTPVAEKAPTQALVSASRVITEWA